MRLIDADKLKRQFVGNKYGAKAVEYWIDNAPTVEAIPIKWIEKWVRNDPTADPDTFTDMVADWRKENGELV